MYKICIAITIINSVILVYSLPTQPKSVYEYIKNGSQDEKILCPYLRKSVLIEPEPEFLKVCGDFEKLKLLKNVTKATEVDALCILYYNSFLSLCYISNGLTEEQYNSVNVGNKMVTNVTGACGTFKQLDTGVGTIKEPLIAIFHTLQSDVRCSHLCSDLDGNLLPICGYAAYMVNAASVINNSNRKGNKDNHTIEDKTSKEVEHRTNVTADSADETKPNQVDQDNQKDNMYLKMQEHAKTSNKDTQQSPNNAKLPLPNSDSTITPTGDKLKSDGGKSAAQKHSEPDAAKSELPKEKTPVKPSSEIEDKSHPPMDLSSNNSPNGHKNPPNISKNPPNILKNHPVNPQNIPINPQNIPINHQNLPVKHQNLPVNPQSHPIKTPADISENPKKDEPNSKPEIPSNPNKNNVVADVDANASDIFAEDVGANPNEQEEGGTYGSHEFETDINNDVVPPKAKDVEKPNTNVKPHETKEDTLPLNYGESMDGDDSYFFSYFMMVCAVFILGYVGYHNKQKVLALVLEGRRGRRPSRTRRPNSANYHKLDSNLEEAVTSSCNKNTTNIIY